MPLEKGKSWAECGFTEKKKETYTQTLGRLDKNHQLTDRVDVEMVRLVGTNPKTGETVSTVYPANEKERFKMNKALAKSGSVAFNKKGESYVVSEKLRHRSQGEVAKGSRDTQMYNYKKNHK